jgi:hypothetical protein
LKIEINGDWTDVVVHLKTSIPTNFFEEFTFNVFKRKENISKNLKLGKE